MKYLSLSFVLFLLFFLSCDKQSISPDREIDSSDYKGMVKISLDMTDAPSEVKKLTGKLYNNNNDEINFTLEIIGNLASALVEDIPAGKWSLRIDAYNENDVIIYTGTTEVEINPDIVTPVSIHLNPATGSLEITVTWGNYPNLVAYYPFNGNANDESGNEHHGKVNGSILAEDRFGNEKSAYYFDGIDDEIFIGYDSDLDITGDITICAWFKTETPQWGSLVSNFDQHMPDNGYELCVGSLYKIGGFIYFEFAENDIKDGFSTYNSFNDGQWHFVAVVLAPDGVSKGKVYVDGAEQAGYDRKLGRYPIPSIGATPDYPFKIGAASNGTGPESAANFEGIIDDVRIYNGILNTTEIEYLFQSRY